MGYAVRPKNIAGTHNLPQPRRSAEPSFAVTSAYTNLLNILAGYVGQFDIDPGPAVLELLAVHGIRPRDKDGHLLRITVSRPTSNQRAFALGLRYKKKDGPLTEDLFQVDPDTGVTRNNNGCIERMWPEYSDTHKSQALSPLPTEPPVTITAVDTFTFKP